MLFRAKVRKFTADLILLTKFKKIIGMTEKYMQNIEVPVSVLMDFLFDILHFTMVFRGRGLSKLFPFIFS